MFHDNINGLERTLIDKHQSRSDIPLPYIPRLEDLCSFMCFDFGATVYLIRIASLPDSDGV